MRKFKVGDLVRGRSDKGLYNVTNKYMTRGVVRDVGGNYIDAEVLEHQEEPRYIGEIFCGLDPAQFELIEPLNSGAVDIKAGHFVAPIPRKNTKYFMSGTMILGLVNNVDDDGLIDVVIVKHTDSEFVGSLVTVDPCDFLVVDPQINLNIPEPKVFTFEAGNYIVDIEGDYWLPITLDDRSILFNVSTSKVIDEATNFVGCSYDDVCYYFYDDTKRKVSRIVDGIEVR